MKNLLQHLQEGEADLLVKTPVKALIFIIYPKVQHPLSACKIVSSNIQYATPKSNKQA